MVRVGTRFQQMRGEGVAQRMQGDWFGEARDTTRLLARGLDGPLVIGARAYRRGTARRGARFASTRARCRAGAARASRSDPCGPSLIDAQHHALAVDVGDPQMRGLRHAQSRRRKWW